MLRQMVDSQRMLLRPSNHDRTTSLNSLFLALPVEVQVEIFMWCMPTLPGFSPCEAPMLLTQVSSEWRTLALGTPVLWASLSFDTEPRITRQSYGTGVLDMLQLWLQRSKECPLTIRISHSAAQPEALPQAFMTILKAHSERWHSLHLLVPQTDLLPLMDPPSRGYPTLQDLCLVMATTPWQRDSLINIHNMNISWRQLARLHIQLPYDQLLALDECHALLSNCPAVAWCTLNARWETSAAEPLVPLRLPKLRYLHLKLQGSYGGPVDGSGTPESSLVDFLDSVSSAQLTFLQLEWLVHRNQTETDWSGSDSKFLAYLGTQSHSLATLRLSYLPLGEVELIDSLGCLPLLEEVDLKFPFGDSCDDPFTDAFFSSCAGSTPGIPFLPRLRTLSLQSHGQSFTNEGLTRFICSRRDPSGVCSQLQSFHLFSFSPVFEGLLDELKYFVDAGLSATFESVTAR